jgi:chaperone required for assembly of F1-ATPase
MFTKGKAQPLERPKRFYKTVDTAQVATGFGVRLDGRAPKTPQGRPLVLPTQAAAELLASEWAGQREEIVMGDMPATRLAFTAIDAVAEARDATAAEVARYAGSDLLCYFAQSPANLVQRQLVQWGPVLDWARDELGLTFERTVGVVHKPQPPATVDAVKALAERLDDFALAGLAHAAGLYGSAILAFALERDKLDGEAAFDLSRLDEAYQEEGWGVDAEAAERTARLRREAVMLEAWFQALRS